jgi:DNA integrity scanning protein DisA with diadenylate cyclase activity
MNHIPTFGEFSASLNESIETFNINSIEDLSTIDDIIKVTEAMNQSDPIMWRGM